MVQQPSTNGQITRPEYEARHSALQAQLSQVEARLVTEQTSIKADIERKFDRLLDNLDKLRDDLVTKDSLKPVLEVMENRLKAIEQEQMSRVERFWMKIGPLVTIGIGIITLVEFLTHFRIVP